MRTVSFILTLFVLSLAVMPCTDTMIPTHDHSETEVASHVDNNSHDHGEEEDDCPPFCACQCCGIHVLGPNNSLAELIESKANDTYIIHYSFNYSYDFLGGIWHPPSVS
jgi:hypothetical protein